MASTRRSATSTLQVIDALSSMIASGEFLPGQQLRQESLAERLGVSRLPVREALRRLEADGLVTHTPNAGYTVARLSVSEFTQVYIMRRLLETELIRTVRQPNAQELEHLEALNEQMAKFSANGDLAQMRTCNVEFHFCVFRLSPQNLVIDAVQRLWVTASPYQVMYLTQPQTREAVLSEHRRMIDALRRGDRTELAAIMDAHRQGTEVQVSLLLAAG